MMKNSFCISLLLICFCICSNFAQDETSIEVELSAEYKIPAGTYLESILSTDSDNIYLLRKDYSGNILSGGIGAKLKSIIIESYDRENLKLKNAVDIDLKYQKKLRTFHEIFSVKGNLFLITSFFNSAKRKNYLFAQKLNKKFSPSDDLILIGEIDSRNESQTGDFIIHHSRDTSKIIIYNDLPTKGKENERAKIGVFDANFEKIWEKKINLPFESKLYERIKFDVDNQGNAYVLGKHYFEKRKETRKRKPNYEFILEAYTEDGEQKDKYQLNDSERFISDLTFEVNRKEQVICTGFYSNSKPQTGNNVGINTNRWGNGGRIGNSLQGIVFFTVDNTTKIIAKKKFTEFGIDFIAMNESDRRRETLERKANDSNDYNDPGLFSYEFRDVILRSDGGAVIIAEQFYTYRQSNTFNDFRNNQQFGSFRTNGNNFQETYVNVFGDIIVVNINPDGSIRWANSIPKFQSSLDYSGSYQGNSINNAQQSSDNIQDRSLSFANSNYKDKIQMVFNERVDFFESDSSFGEKLISSKRNRYGLAMASLNKSGELDIQLVASNKDMGVQVLPKLTKQIDKKELIFYGQFKNMFRIGKIILN